MRILFVWLVFEPRNLREWVNDNALSFRLVGIFCWLPYCKFWDSILTRFLRDWSFCLEAQVCPVSLCPCSPSQTCTCSCLKMSWHKQEQVKMCAFWNTFIKHWNRAFCFGKEKKRKYCHFTVTAKAGLETLGSCDSRKSWSRFTSSEMVTEEIQLIRKMCVLNLKYYYICIKTLVVRLSYNKTSSWITLKFSFSCCK